MPRTHSTYPLFPTDDGWPYPDGPLAEAADPIADDDIDLDALELRADPHVFADLTPREHEVLSLRFGLRGPALSMKELSRALGCSHADARECLGRAIDKVRARLTAGDGPG